MPRAPRVEFSGAFYHVMNRGDHFDPIFRDNEDREIFIKTLRETCQSAGWIVHSFVLMRNHYHLLIETKRPTLVKGMQYLNGAYTQRFNARHKLRGHLFQGRYKALLVDVEAKGYFLTVSDYIHMNPVRAKLVSTFEDLIKDPWSSVGWLSGKRTKKPDWLHADKVYGELGLQDWTSKSRRHYRVYLKQRVQEETSNFIGYRKIRTGWCLGSLEFVEEMKEKLMEVRAKKPRGPECWSGEHLEELEEERAERLLSKGMQQLGLTSLENAVTIDKYLLAKFVRNQSKVRVEWLASRFRVGTRGGMSHMLYQVSKKINSNKTLLKKWNNLIKVTS